MAVLAQGTTVTIGGSIINATRVSVNNGDNANNGPRVSIATLSSNPDEEEPYLLTWAPYAEQGSAKTVQIDYIGGGEITPGSASVNLVITGPIAFSAPCTVVSSSVTAQVADVIRGSVTLSFK